MYHCWQCANYASDICSRGTDITSEICSGAHISQGNTYHCNTGPVREIGRPKLNHCTVTHPAVDELHPFVCASLSLSHQAFRYLYALCTVLFIAEGIFAFSVQQYPYF